MIFLQTDDNRSCFFPDFGQKMGKKRFVGERKKKSVGNRSGQFSGESLI